MKKSHVLAAAAIALCGVSAVATAGNLSVGANERVFSMEEMLSPVWEGTTSYSESVLVVEESDGSIAPIQLLYPIESIVSVTDTAFKRTYTEGVDYTVENGKLVVKPTGTIPKLTYAEFHPTTGQAGFESRSGGYICFYEGAWYHQRQIYVNYTHAEGYDGYIPEGKGRLLSQTHEKLKESHMNILVYGDSISVGGNSSGCSLIKAEPYMPIYAEMFAEGLQQIYGVETVNVYNPSVGGTDSAWGLGNLRAGVLDKYDDVDLVILAFGMNDVTRDPESYASNMKRMASGVKSKYKDADILLIAPMLPNYDAVNFYGTQPDFYEYLMENEKEGIAVVNMTKVHEGVLQKKRYADMTGNNVNHANDYLARLYAQTLLKTLEISDYGTPVEPDIPDVPDNSQSSELPTQSSEENSSSASTAAKSGCGGSLVSCGGMLGGVAVAAVGFRKKNKKK